MFVGNIRAPPNTSQQQPSSSNDVCGSHMKCTAQTSRPERCTYIFTFIYFLLCTIIAVPWYLLSFTTIKFRQHNSILWDGPMYPYSSSCHARMQSFASWPTASKQKPEYLSGDVFSYR